MNYDTLFCKNSINEFFKNIEQQIIDRIDTLNVESLETTEKEKLINNFVLSSPKIFEDKAVIQHNETKKNILDPFGEQISVDALEITITIPIEGDYELMYYKPTTYALEKVYGNIDQQNLILSFLNSNYDPKSFNNEYQKLLNSIKKHLEWLSKDINRFNDNLPHFVNTLLKNRLEKTEKNKKFIETLGIPLKK